jgi:ketosteroid isomerase-like protein
MQTFFLTSTFTSAKGQAMKGRLSVSNLWQKREEGWRIVYTHESNMVR